jgi:hypothetical protein
MDRSALVSSLSAMVPEGLAVDLVDSFLQIRQHLATRTTGHAAPGKFVESVVQALQCISSGRYESAPKVDDYLRSVESTASNLDEGLRICVSRIARAMYTLRNKRNIAHKGLVDVNVYDLQFLHGAAQWILAELLRTAAGVSMQDAGRLIEQVQSPIHAIVEDFDSRRLVLRDLNVRKEILVLLHSYYPDAVPVATIVSSLNRRSAKTVRNVLPELWRGKSIEGDTELGYKLTQRGFDESQAIVARCLEQGDAA